VKTSENSFNMPPVPQSAAIKFLAPSFILWANETPDGTTATAEFSIGDTTKLIQLEIHTFVQVGGEQIGGPELVSVTFHTPGIAEPFTIVPALSDEVGPDAYTVLQPGGSPEGYGLDIVQPGVPQKIIPFLNTIDQDKAEEIEHTIGISNGAVYNGLSTADATLSVRYHNGGLIITTPFVKSGNETGGLLTGTILAFDITLEETPLITKWAPKESAVGSPGLPIVVIGESDAPSIAIFRPVGYADIIQLERVSE
jgi:hypothetical protein